MKKVMIKRKDANQVQSILRVHAEMQDMGAMRLMEQLTIEKDLKKIEELTYWIASLEKDAINLRRIADLYS